MCRVVLKLKTTPHIILRSHNEVCWQRHHTLGLFFTWTSGLSQGNGNHVGPDISLNHMASIGKQDKKKNITFQLDKNSKYTSKPAIDEIKVLEWSSQIPKLNPAAHLWVDLKRPSLERLF